MGREIVIVLDNIRSALNVGAIMRTCDGAGVNKLYMVGITPFPPHPKVIKTALGAENYIEFEYSKNIETIIKLYKELGYEIISVEQTNKSIMYQNFKFSDKTLLIFGNEITGVSMNSLENSTHHIELPMKGGKGSLNVATTVGIITYHLAFTAN